MSSSSYLRSFLDFIKRSGNLWKILIPAALGLLLIALGSFGMGEDYEPAALTDADSIAELCSEVEGVGRCRVMITRDESGVVTGAVVLCEGAESPEVRLRLTELLRALLGVGSNRIRIDKIGGG